MLCLTPDAFAYFLNLLDASVIVAEGAGFWIGEIPTWWEPHPTLDLWCAPDVPNIDQGVRMK